MNATNPFQIPTWAQINREQRRRERFKRTVMVTIAAAVLLLVVLLIEGCKMEQAAMSTPARLQVYAPPAVPATPPPQPVSKTVPAAVASRSVTVYVIKPGDTLSRIAKAHGTTVRAIEAANNLDGDQILAGAKLKIPAA